jgi:phospholipid/cholesterol/gamma-HCH transport system substrate-binding protein
MAEIATGTFTSNTVQWRNLRTGILFVLVIAIMAVLALVIGKNTSALSKKVTYKIFVPDIGGLAENNLVSVAGKKSRHRAVIGFCFAERYDHWG